MVSLLVSKCRRSSVASKSDQMKSYNIGICCFSSKNAPIRNKSKFCLAQNQDDVSKGRDMSTCESYFNKRPL